MQVFENSRDILITIFVPSGISKILIPNQLARLWPKLPYWFWPLAGSWEIVAAMLLLGLNGESPRHSLAMPMICSFLGGVYYSLLVIPPKVLNRQRLLSSIALLPATITLFVTIQLHISTVKQQTPATDGHFSSILLVLKELFRIVLYVASGYEFGSLLSGGSGSRKK